MSSTADRLQVVLHVVDRPEDLERAVGAARALAEARPGVRARIVVNGSALAGLTVEAPALDTGAAPIEACSVGLQRREIPAELLQPGIGTTESAILALADAQLAGAAYIRL